MVLFLTLFLIVVAFNIVDYIIKSQPIYLFFNSLSIIAWTALGIPFSHKMQYKRIGDMWWLHFTTVICIGAHKLVAESGAAKHFGIV
jgi:hypothetical protein